MLAPVVEIYCDIDDFCKKWFAKTSPYLLPNPQRQRHRLCRLSSAEIMTIVILFQLSHYRTFKDYYHDCVQEHMRSYFPNLLSYNRFVEVMQSVMMPLAAYLSSRLGKKTGLYYIDATALKVCHNKRIRRHKTFNGLAERGKTSMGWFFGFKLHLVINHLGEIVSFCVTKGNVDDRVPLTQLCSHLTGLLAADKGYLSKQKEDTLSQQGLKLLTKVRRNMKQKVSSSFEKYFLAQRGIIETVIEQLKSICQVEHTRHRKPENFLINLLGSLVAYMIKPRKPSLKIRPLNHNQHSFLMSS